MGGSGPADILLTGFSGEDADAMRGALESLGKPSFAGDPVNDADPSIVFAAAYDESSLRGSRAAAMEESRPWCFCVPLSERRLVAAAAYSREGRMLLLPPDERELKRVLSALAEDAKERSAGDAAFGGLSGLEASFSWKTCEVDVSRVCRSLARLLREAAFYADRSEEDECALALEEALVNAVEHGNLGLDSSLRPADPTAEDRYEAERARRLADPAFGGKLVRLSLSIGEGEARVTIEDEGEGFDTSGIVEEPTGLDVSGKGFWLIKKPFDEAVYDSKGNRLTLARRRPRAARR
jgi:anti-sigma regulatory factor (Ser/Thr protein kinase)